MHKIILIFIPFIFLIFSCDVINPSEEIPSYIKVSKFDVEGINDLPASEDIVDVWVNVDNQSLGVYEFNKEGFITIPILKSGNLPVILRPGIIKDAGFNNIHQAYPYYKDYKANVTLVRGEVLEITPKTAYTDDAIRISATDEDFETGLNRQFRTCFGCGIALNIINKNDSNFNSLFVEKNGSAVGYLKIPQGSSDSIRILTKSAFSVTNNASQIWLEFDYKSNMIFTAGLEINQQLYYRITPFLLASPDKWQKAYLALIDDFSIFSNLGLTFNLVFSSPQSDGAADYYIAIDNIRIIVPNN